MDEAFNNLIERSGRLCSTDTQILIRDRYETQYNIYNHDHPKADHPFALILQHWNEDNVSTGPLYERMNQYIDFRIHHHFGLSLDEFLDRPTFMCELLLRTAGERNKKEVPQMDEAVNQLTKQMNSHVK